MVARSLKKIEKAHALNKRVRREKARLRALGPKKKARKPNIKPAVRIHIKLTPEVKATLLAYCEKNNIKPYKAIKIAIRNAMDRDEKYIKEFLNNGV